MDGRVTDEAAEPPPPLLHAASSQSLGGLTHVTGSQSESEDLSEDDLDLLLDAAVLPLDAEAPPQPPPAEPARQPIISLSSRFFKVFHILNVVKNTVLQFWPWPFRGF